MFFSIRFYVFLLLSLFQPLYSTSVCLQYIMFIFNKRSCFSWTVEQIQFNNLIELCHSNNIINFKLDYLWYSFIFRTAYRKIQMHNVSHAKEISKSCYLPDTHTRSCSSPFLVAAPNYQAEWCMTKILFFLICLNHFCYFKFMAVSSIHNIFTKINYAEQNHTEFFRFWSEKANIKHTILWRIYKQLLLLKNWARTPMSSSTSPRIS